MLSPVWPSDKQFRKHKAAPITEAVLKSRTVATNHFGRPEGVFYYKKDDITLQEFCCDIDMRKEKGADGVERLLVVTLIYLCPRCLQSCCVHGHGSTVGGANKRNIEVHWEDMRQSPEDGLWRPALSVEGMLSCDYSWSEISGIVAPRLSDKCGWKGRIEEGRCYETPGGSLIHLSSR